MSDVPFSATRASINLTAPLKSRPCKALCSSAGSLGSDVTAGLGVVGAGFSPSFSSGALRATDAKPQTARMRTQWPIRMGRSLFDIRFGDLGGSQGASADRKYTTFTHYDVTEPEKFVNSW